MKKTIVIAIATLFGVMACGLFSGIGFRTVIGSGEIATETRDVAGFDRVDVCCGMTLHLTQEGSESLQIEADDNFMEEIITRVENGLLRIYYRDTSNVSYRPSQQVRVYLSVANLREVSISGGGDLDAESLTGEGFKLELSGGSEAILASLKVEDVEVDISGGGDIQAALIRAEHIKIDLSGGSDADLRDLTADTFRLDCSGGGSAEISGVVSALEVELSGGSRLDGGDLAGDTVIFSSSGGGNSTIWAETSLAVRLSGGSSLSYYGFPDILRQDLSGGSSINSLGEH